MWRENRVCYGIIRKLCNDAAVFRCDDGGIYWGVQTLGLSGLNGNVEINCSLCSTCKMKQYVDAKKIDSAVTFSHNYLVVIFALLGLFCSLKYHFPKSLCKCLVPCSHQIVNIFIHNNLEKHLKARLAIFDIRLLLLDCSPSRFSSMQIENQ